MYIHSPSLFKLNIDQVQCGKAHSIFYLFIQVGCQAYMKFSVYPTASSIVSWKQKKGTADQKFKLWSTVLWVWLIYIPGQSTEILITILSTQFAPLHLYYYAIVQLYNKEIKKFFLHNVKFTSEDPCNLGSLWSITGQPRLKTGCRGESRTAHANFIYMLSIKIMVRWQARKSSPTRRLSQDERSGKNV